MCFCWVYKMGFWQFCGFGVGCFFFMFPAWSHTFITTPTHLASLEAKRPKLGSLWRGFKADIDKPLAAILSLNTILIQLALWPGAQATKLFGELYFGIIWPCHLMILIFSKSFLKLWELDTGSSLPLPVVIFCVGYSGWCIPWWWFQKNYWVVGTGKDDPSVSRDDFHMLARMGHQEGVINAEEAKAAGTVGI